MVGKKRIKTRRNLVALATVLLLVFAVACGPAAPATLFLEVTEPEDGSEVSTGDIHVRGSTIPGAMVSVLVDEEVWIADVDEDGNFSVIVTLEVGPNYIEVVASDQEGSEEYSTRTVIYTP